MTKVRKVAVVTSSRADYGIMRPVIRAMFDRAELDVQLLVTGSHLAQEHGQTVHDIERDDIPISARIPILEGDDLPEHVSRTMARAIDGFANTYAKNMPDLVMVLGDRYEMFAAALASVPFVVPLAHIHGGEITLGAFDNAFRHALTKLSHLHFVSTAEHRDRVIQMGEEPRYVFLTGAPSLDAVRTFEPLKHAELEQFIGMPLQQAPLLITFHPETLSGRQADTDMRIVLSAAETFQGPIIITGANADVSGALVRQAAQAFAAAAPNRTYIPSLGSRAYFTVLRIAAAMLGNSSSGIVESPSFAVPVVNVGDRQTGRLHPVNVIDCPCEVAPISEALRRACSAEFRHSLIGMSNPYGDGHAAARIANIVATTALGPSLVRKEFWDLDKSGG